MEFEREFNKVDKALSAAALSATIIHKQVCSHQDIATLESLVPGMIFDNQWAYGFTNETSLENFQKVKEVVSNAIKTAIAKIKELIKKILGWFQSSRKTVGNTTEVKKDIAKKEENFKEAVDEIVKASENKTNARKDISDFDPYNPKNYEKGRDKPVFDIGLLSIDKLSAQQIIDIVKNRKLTVDAVMLKILENRLDIPFMWLESNERDVLLRELLAFNWIGMAEVFKEYENVVIRTGQQGYDVKVWNRLSSMGGDKGLDALGWMDSVKEVCDKITEKYLKRDSQYVNSGANPNDVENTKSLYAYYSVFFKPRKDLRGATEYTGEHQKIKREAVPETLEAITAYAKQIVEEIKNVEKCLPILEDVARAFDVHGLVQGTDFRSVSYKLCGKSVNEWTLLTAMAIRTYNLMLKGFENIITQLTKYGNDLDKIVESY